MRGARDIARRQRKRAAREALAASLHGSRRAQSAVARESAHAAGEQGLSIDVALHLNTRIESHIFQ